MSAYISTVGHMQDRDTRPGIFYGLFSLLVGAVCGEALCEAEVCIELHQHWCSFPFTMRLIPRNPWRKLLLPLPLSPKTLQRKTLRWVCFFWRSIFLSLVTAGEGEGGWRGHRGLQRISSRLLLMHSKCLQSVSNNGDTDLTRHCYDAK